jgi:hypothetical protein
VSTGGGLGHPAAKFLPSLDCRKLINISVAGPSNQVKLIETFRRAVKVCGRCLSFQKKGGAGISHHLTGIPRTNLASLSYEEQQIMAAIDFKLKMSAGNISTSLQKGRNDEISDSPAAWCSGNGDLCPDQAGYSHG